MSGNGQVNGRWLELARVRVPVEKAAVWRALLDKTEHPERYNPTIARAELIDHDPTVVLRRTWPAEGKPFAEYVRHELRAHRVEYQRYGLTWRTAQALVETDDGPCLIYEVLDAEGAQAHAGIDAAHARRTLEHLLEACSNGIGRTPPSPSF